MRLPDQTGDRKEQRTPQDSVLLFHSSQETFQSKLRKFGKTPKNNEFCTETSKHFLSGVSLIPFLWVCKIFPWCASFWPCLGSLSRRQMLTWGLSVPTAIPICACLFVSFFFSIPFLNQNYRLLKLCSAEYKQDSEVDEGGHGSPLAEYNALKDL